MGVDMAVAVKTLSSIGCRNDQKQVDVDMWLERVGNGLQNI